MTPQQLLKHFETQVKAAAALHCSQSTISCWVTRGRIPAAAQLRVQAVTQGKLKADASVQRKYGRLAA